MRRLAAIVAALALLGAPASAAAAACPKTSLSAVENQVMCVQCGVPLAVAESPSADQERSFISAQVAQCRSASQIKRALVFQYGDRVLALPRASGFGLAAYLVPALALVAGLAAVTFAALRWRRRRAPAAPIDAPGPAPDDAARLDADLSRFGP
jgi:cytochrome c-type biogenesis protein CcmH